MKTFLNKHNHGHHTKYAKVIAKWLAKKYVANFKGGFLQEAKVMKSQFYKEYGFEISLDKAYRVKRICIKIIFGDEEK